MSHPAESAPTPEDEGAFDAFVAATGISEGEAHDFTRTSFEIVLDSIRAGCKKLEPALVASKNGFLVYRPRVNDADYTILLASNPRIAASDQPVISVNCEKTTGQYNPALGDDRVLSVLDLVVSPDRPHVNVGSEVLARPRGQKTWQTPRWATRLACRADTVQLYGNLATSERFMPREITETDDLVSKIDQLWEVPFLLNYCTPGTQDERMQSMTIMVESD